MPNMDVDEASLDHHIHFTDGETEVKTIVF